MEQLPCEIYRREASWRDEGSEASSPCRRAQGVEECPLGHAWAAFYPTIASRLALSVP